MIGTERSGTNLMRLILNCHSKIAVPHPPHIMKNFSRLEALYGNLKNDDNFRKLIRDVVRMVELHPYPWGIKIDEARVFAYAKDRNLLSVFFSIYDRYLEHVKKERWGCKSTFVIHHIASILRYYPDAKFIYMVRDGRDVANSAKKSIFNRYHVYYAAHLWKQEQQVGFYWLHKLSSYNIFLIKYEELLDNPEGCVKSLCSFLDESFEETMLTYFHSEEAQKCSSISTSWRNTSLPIIRNNSGKYKKESNKEEIALFEAIAAPELDYFSYPLMIPLEISEQRRNQGIKKCLIYWIKERHLMIKAQVKHLFSDKNNFKRYKKFWYLKWLKIIRKVV